LSAYNRLAVIGDPIAHSLSPAMHAAALQAAGIAGSYQAIHVASPELETQVRLLRDQGYRGFNVTVPHKERVVACLDQIDVSAQIGAVNTIVNQQEVLIGYNTDIAGFSRALRSLLPDPTGLRAVVLGAGGSALAVVHALQLERATVTVVNRTVARAEYLASRVSRRMIVLRSGLEAADAIKHADLLVNTTPLGMGDLAALSALPDGSRLSSHTAVFDLVYGRTTPLLAQAAAAGCATADGLEMLVQQGALSFQLWTGIAPDITVMRDACARALEVPTCFAS